jgi:acetylornithine deacetylase
MVELNKFLMSLLKIDSFSNNEKQICDYVYGFLKKENFQVEKISVDDNGFNIIIKEGNPNIFFSTHLDTVKSFLEVKEDDKYIYGRGACDAKGCVAAMIQAAIECKKETINNFGIIFTVGEETNFRGVRKIIEKEKNLPFIIVGEPTSLDIVNEHHGIISLELLSIGKKAHSSIPEEGINAINKLIQAINKIKEIIMGPESSMSVCKIEGGTANNVIPNKAKATISFRVSPKDKTDYVEEINALIQGLATIRVIEDIKSISTKIPAALSFIPNVKAVKYATELSVYRNGIVLGPGKIQFAHTDEEKISKEELKKAVKIYKQIIINYNKKEEMIK